MSSTTSSNWDIQPPLDPKSVGKSGVISLNTWAHEYGVIPSLVPFDYRTHDPVAFVADLREMIEAAHPAKATFASREVFDVTGVQNEVSSTYLEDLIRLTGCWMYDDGSHFVTGDSERTVTRWINPEYVHVKDLEPSITTPQYRIEELRLAASVGIFSRDEIAPRFGITPSCMGTFCYNYEIPWLDWREWGKQRMARTVRVITSWTDWSVSDIADILPIPYNTLDNWVYNRYADDFDVPEDPSNEPWFAPHRGIRGDQS